MNKADQYFKQIVNEILENGSLDKEPRPVWEDKTPAHTISINHTVCTYDFRKGESPLLTLRPIAIKNAIKEILWIYQDQINDLKWLREKYGIKWWDDWKLEDDTIGACYGHTVDRYALMDELLKGLKENPDGRRHIMDLWQYEEFKQPHGLKPCCFMTIWNVRYVMGIATPILDVMVIQRSCDYIVAGCINQFQYSVLLYMIAHHCGYKPGRLTWVCANTQIYDRHIVAAKELIDRDIIPCSPKIVINPNKKDFYSIHEEDIEIKDYPLDIIKEKNPQIKLPVAI